MKIKKIDIPMSVFLLLLFSCTDLYLVSGVKIVYVFCIPIAIFLIKRKILLERKDCFLLSWFLSYFLSVGHIISKFDFWVVKWLKCLILVGFDDMGYDKGFDELDFGFCLILLRF